MKDNRTALIAKIHIAKKQLGLDDATYRDVLERVTGKTSCKEMQLDELKAVFAECKRLGFVPKQSQSTKYGTKPTVSKQNQSRQAMINKIEAILADMGLHWQYAHGVCKVMFGKERLQFCSDGQIYKVVQALAVYQKRQEKNKPKI